ncbi:alpha/beta hydrolase [Aeromicrobium panaciterrae]|uniref:alpha/beta hydrolase n=1 Tax=Aeromicrobium panaciterrae TaxID=363861 RepID=UPI0031D9B6F5
MLRDRPWLTGLIIAAGLALASIAVTIILAVVRHEITSDLPDPGKPLESYAPKTVTGTTDIPYGAGPRQKLDVWFPKSLAAGKVLPTIVWAHGGGWSGGDKSLVAPYLQILADRGFTVVGVNYSLSPGARYPTQVREVNAALGFLNVHASELHVDSSRFVLAGDSGGAQIVAQVASLTTNPTFASQLGVVPVVKPEQVVGVVLASGVVDLSSADRFTGSARTNVIDYIGSTTDDALLRLASVTPHVTSNFPPTWVTSGNADLLSPQVKAFARVLRDKRVDVDEVFFAKGHKPLLIHEYQFLLGLDEAQEALKSLIDFVGKQTRR